MRYRTCRSWSRVDQSPSVMPPTGRGSLLQTEVSMSLVSSDRNPSDAPRGKRNTRYSSGHRKSIAKSRLHIERGFPKADNSFGVLLHQPS